MHQLDKGNIKRCFMSQPLSCNVVILQSLKRRRTAYVNMFDMLKKLFIFNTFKRNISYKYS